MGQWGTHVATEGRIAFDVSFEVDAFVGHTTSLGVSGYLPDYLVKSLKYVSCEFDHSE